VIDSKRPKNPAKNEEIEDHLSKVFVRREIKQILSRKPLDTEKVKEKGSNGQ
jgi:hypothetical protein